MSQGYNVEVSKDLIKIETNQDVWEFIKIGNRIKRSGFKNIYQSIRKKD